MASFTHDAEKHQVTIIQTHGGELSALKKFAKGIDGKTISDVTIGDHPDDVDGEQSPRKVVMFNYG